MNNRDRALLDALLRSDFESFLRRCLIDSKPRHAVSAELAYQGDRLSARARAPG